MLYMRQRQTEEGAMNANQIINMVVRMVMRKLIRSGVDAGMGAVGSRVKKAKGQPKAATPPRGDRPSID